MIEWIKSSERLPVKSGEYLGMSSVSGAIMSMNYSAKNKLFNALDDYEFEKAKKCAIDCKYWAYINRPCEHDYVETQTEKNVTVRILKCKKCGDVSIGWMREE